MYSAMYGEILELVSIIGTPNQTYTEPKYIDVMLKSSLFCTLIIIPFCKTGNKKFCNHASTRSWCPYVPMTSKGLHTKT